MTTHEYERPWQVMPAKIIKLALEYAEKKDDLSHQIAYLLLDIGVETALKVYLVNKGQEIEKINFPTLVERVQAEIPKHNSKLIKQIGDIVYFHGIRNKLYHQGDGVKPTEDNLRRYSALAKEIVREVLEVNLETQEKYAVNIERYERKIEIEELVGSLNERLGYLQESCAIITEKLRPNYGTREFALKLNYILENWPDDEGAEPRDRVYNQTQRLEKYKELTGKSVTDHDLIDLLLRDINHLYVRIALQETSDNLQDIWTRYLDICKSHTRLLYKWKQGMYSERMTAEQISEEYQNIVLWIEAQQKMLDKWISDHIEGISRDGSFGFWDLV